MINSPVTVIILTYNEEKNIEACIKSVVGWAEKIFVVDSFSTDRTIEIAEKMGAEVVSHDFGNYAKQRNWALNNLLIETEWILNLDADHRVMEELKNELAELLKKGVDESVNGFLISRRAIFMGRWIKHGGHYPTYHAPLFRKGKGYCELKKYDQHFVVEGKSKKLSGDIEDVVMSSLESFTARHNRWSSVEAEIQTSGGDNEGIKGRLFGDARERRRFLRNWYHYMPLFCRAFFYWKYRYFIRLGFLDGKEGLIFHFLQGFWYRFLIDAKIYEARKESIKKNF